MWQQALVWLVWRWVKKQEALLLPSSPSAFSRSLLLVLVVVVVAYVGEFIENFQRLKELYNY